MIFNSSIFKPEILEISDIFNHILNNIDIYIINFSIIVGIVGVIVLFMSGKKFGSKVLEMGSKLGSAVSGVAGGKYLYDETKKSFSSGSKSSSSGSKGSSSGNSGNSGNNKSGSSSKPK